jgi:hypothetical protein
MQKRIFLIALLLSVIAVSASALALSDTRQLNAAFNDIKVYIDGELISPKDALDRPVEPFIVDGTTYLPLRAVAEALGKEVEWDGPNQSVYVGRKPLDPSTSKIAIITCTLSQDEETYCSAQELVEKYGADRVVHKTWPYNFYDEQDEMSMIAGQIAADPSIKALIINQAVYGTVAALDELLETRKDMLIIIYADYWSDAPSDLAKRADLIISTDEIGMGPSMV